MTTQNLPPRDSTRATTSPSAAQRLLGVTWLAAAAATVVPAFMLTAVSDHADDLAPGLVLTVLVLVALALGFRLLSSAAPSGRRLSLLGSAAWLLGAAVVLPTQEFSADALWAGGVPLVAAVVTGLLAWRLRP